MPVRRPAVWVRPAHRYSVQAGFWLSGIEERMPKREVRTQRESRRTAIYISEATPRQRTTRQWAEPQAAAAQLLHIQPKIQIQRKIRLWPKIQAQIHIQAHAQIQIQILVDRGCKRGLATCPEGGFVATGKTRALGIRSHSHI